MMMRVGRGVSSLRIDSARPAIRVTGQEMGIRERERGERISQKGNGKYIIKKRRSE
jgi:hypothetical protein